MTTPPPALLLTTTNESLAPLLPILNAFAHRHTNQHSSSHWWSSFSILRRAARNLSADLSRPRQPKTRNKSSRNVDRDNHPAFARARWMARHVVPRAYVAFTQLAADNQHAPLGLLLLSILAHINRLLSDLVPADPKPDHPPLLASAVERASCGADAPSAQDTPAAADTPADMGVAISRDEILLPEKSATPQLPAARGSSSHDVKTKERKHKNSTRVPVKSLAKETILDKPKKKKKKGVDAFSSLFGSL
ncbi:hypothetical protein ACJ41O_000427 [Fusarium nematophilum]